MPFFVAVDIYRNSWKICTTERDNPWIQMIIDGEMDEYPEAAFFNVGTIDEVIEKAKTLKDGE